MHVCSSDWYRCCSGNTCRGFLECSHWGDSGEGKSPIRLFLQIARVKLSEYQDSRIRRGVNYYILVLCVLSDLVHLETVKMLWRHWI